jgi:hypothetical protein
MYRSLFQKLGETFEAFPFHPPLDSPFWGTVITTLKSGHKVIIEFPKAFLNKLAPFKNNAVEAHFDSTLQGFG